MFRRFDPTSRSTMQKVFRAQRSQPDAQVRKLHELDLALSARDRAPRLNDSNVIDLNFPAFGPEPEPPAQTTPVEYFRHRYSLAVDHRVRSVVDEDLGHGSHAAAGLCFRLHGEGRSGRHDRGRLVGFLHPADGSEPVAANAVGPAFVAGSAAATR